MSIVFRILIFSALWLQTSTMPGAAQDRASAERQFKTWLQTQIWPMAKSRGVTASTFKKSTRGLTPQWSLSGLVPPGSKPAKNQRQNQAEFRGPSRYFSEENLQAQARTGRALYKKWKSTLDKIERRFGVPGRILLAIWGRETAFGRAKIPHSAIRVLATKAFMSTRKELFLEEFLSALVIVERGSATLPQMLGSNAGAMGHPQFMPSSFLKFAIDFDGDGRRDIWKSIPDSLASMANFLAKNGWEKNRDWGFESVLPANLSCAQEGPDRARLTRDWNRLGITRFSGKPFPAAEKARKTMLLVPAGRYGPHFIVTSNFYVLKKYNNSDLYALYIGNLADRIAYNGGAFKNPWQPQDKMLRSQIAKMQRGLERLGYDVGGADGLPGFKTRRSVGEWQISQGKTSSCFPDRQIIRQF